VGGFDPGFFNMRYWLPVLLVGVFLGGAGLILEIGIVPAVDAYLKVTPANPEAPFVFAVIIAFFGAVGAALHFWCWKKAQKEVVAAPSATFGAIKDE
jgi:hypothetical protein